MQDWDRSDLIAAAALAFGIASFLVSALREWLRGRRAAFEIYGIVYDNKKPIILVRNLGPARASEVRLRAFNKLGDPMYERLTASWPEQPWELPAGHAIHLHETYGLMKDGLTTSVDLEWKDRRLRAQGDRFLITRKPA